MNREKIIESLAASYGISSGKDTRYSDSRFDASTGTLYCEGMAITKSTVIKALEYFSKQKDYLKGIAEREPATVDNYLNSVVAYNAIAMLVNQLKES